MNSNTRNIIITVKTRKQDEATPAPKPETPETEEQVEVQESNGYSTFAMVLANQAFQYAKGQVHQIASYEINKYFTLRDDYEGQQDLNNAVSMISWLANSANVIASTAQMGAAAGGFAGAVVGATVATVGIGISKAISVVQALDAQALQIAQAGAQQAFSLSRYGNALTNGSIGEGL